MAEINSVESIVNPELPKVLDNEQIHVYVPKASYNAPGIAAFTSEHFTLDASSNVRIRDSIMQTIGTGALIVPDDLSPGESGLVGLANSNHRNLHRHIGLSADSDAVLPLAEDPHKTQLAIRTRIRKHNEDEKAHSYIRGQIPTQIKNHNEDETAHPYIRKKAEDDLKAHNEDRSAHPYIQGRLSELDAKYSSIEVQLTGKGYVYTIVSWEALKEAIANPDQRVFTLREDDSEDIKLRLLDLVTGDTIYVLEPDAPDFYVVKANVVDETIEPEVYQGLELTYSFQDEIAGYLFTQGIFLSNLVDGGGAFSLMTPDSVNTVETPYSIVLGKNNAVRGNVLSSGRKNERVHVLGNNFSIDDLTEEGLHVSDMFVVGRYNKITTAQYNGQSFSPNTDQSFSSFVDINGFANYVKGNYVSVHGVNNYSQIESVARVFGVRNELYGDESYRVDVFGGQNVVRDSTYAQAFGLLNNVSKGHYTTVYGRSNDFYNYTDLTDVYDLIYGQDSRVSGSAYTFMFGNNNRSTNDNYCHISGDSNISRQTTNTLMHGSDNQFLQSSDSIIIGSHNFLGVSVQSAAIGYANSADQGNRNCLFGYGNILGFFPSFDEENEEYYDTPSANYCLYGQNNNGSGNNTVVYGAENECNELFNSFVLGATHVIYGSNNMSLGYGHNIGGKAILSLGESNTATPGVTNSILVGEENRVDPLKKSVMIVGGNNVSSGNKIINFGYNNNIEGNNQIILTDDYRPKDNGYYLDNFIGVGSGLGFGERSVVLGENVWSDDRVCDSVLLGKTIHSNSSDRSYVYHSLVIGKEIGLFNSSSNSNIVAVGQHMITKGDDCIAVGYYGTADYRSVSVGDNCMVRHDCLGVGKSNYAYTPNSLLVGTRNRTIELDIDDNGMAAVGYTNGVGSRSLSIGCQNNYYDDYEYPANSIAVGYKNRSPNQSIMVGTANSYLYSSSKNLICVGESNSAARSGVVVGRENSAGYNGSALGVYCTAAGNSLALGTNAITMARSLGIGVNTNAGRNSAVIGTVISTLEKSLAVGETIDVDNYCVAIGQGITSYADGQLLFGLYPQVSEDTVIAVGRGTSGGRKNVFAVYYNEDDGASIWFGNSVFTEDKLSTIVNDVNYLKNQLIELDELLQEV